MFWLEKQFDRVPLQSWQIILGTFLFAMQFSVKHSNNAGEIDFGDLFMKESSRVVLAENFSEV